MTDTASRLSAALADRYRIDRELGAGGMATVYLAYDLKHDRQVAVKVLRPGLAEVIGAGRFLAEIRTTANLQHPHILPLHDSGVADDLLYYVMPFVDGVSLRDRIESGHPLPIADAVRIFAQVASALDYAHRRGVVHRDIKPENILLQDDQALVADFGIALATNAESADRLTQTGLSLGTPQYMSPEQVLGERALDARSDIYSVGVMLYETLTGVLPFTGPTAHAIVAKALTEQAPPPSHHRSDVPPELDAAVMTAINRDPGQRFQTAAALQAALSTQSAPTSIVHPPERTSRRAMRVVGIAAAIVLAAAGYLATHRHGDTPPPAAGASRSIVALPFENFGGDSAAAYLADGIPEEILGNLANLPDLAVRPMPRDPRYRAHPDLTSVAKELHADVILTGSLLAQGDSLRVTVRPYDVTLNTFLPSVAFTNTRHNVFGLEDSLSRALAARLNVRAASVSAAASVRHGRPENPAAHDTLLLARWYSERRDCASLDRAVTLLTSATRLDPGYAQAWADLAQTHNLRAAYLCARGIDEYVPARVAIGRAMALDSNNADVHVTLGFMHVIADWDWPRAAAEFERAVQLDPTRATTWLFRTWYFVATDRLDSARMSIRHAEDLDPSSSIIRTRVGTVLYFSDSTASAVAELRTVLDREPGFLPAEQQIAPAYADLHRCPEALAAIQASRAASARSGDVVYVEARCGAAAAARATLSDWEARAANGVYIGPFQFAVAYAGLGDDAKVFAWLNRAVAERDWQLWELGVYPAFKRYHSNPAFRKLMRRVYSPPTG